MEHEDQHDSFSLRYNALVHDVGLIQENAQDLLTEDQNDEVSPHNLAREGLAIDGLVHYLACDGLVHDLDLCGLLFREARGHLIH